MKVLFMDAHVLVTRCCSYHCIPECFHLHLLHCIHCIASVQGESQLQGELDVCMCQQGGEFWEKWSNKGESCLIFFKKLVVHRALRVYHFGRVALVRGKNFVWGVSALVWLLVASFSLCFLHDFVERYLCLWGVMLWFFDRLRRAFALVLGDRFCWVSDCSCLSEPFVTCLCFFVLF